MDLRQSTSVVLQFGPFVSATDGVSLLPSMASAIDNATTGIKLSKNGGSKAVRHATVTTSVYDGGDYKVTLDATDTATLGTLRMVYYDPTTCAPVFADHHVITQNAWDAKYGSATLQVDVTKWNGTAVHAPATAGYPDVNVAKINNVATTSVTTVNANLGVTQPVNFTGTGASALVKSDMVDIAGAAVNTASAQIGAAQIGDLSTTAKASVVTQVNNALDVQLPDSVSANATIPTFRQAQYMNFLANYYIVQVGTALLIKKVDGATTAATLTLDSATSPLSALRTG